MSNLTTPTLSSSNTYSKINENIFTNPTKNFKSANLRYKPNENSN